MPNCYGCKHYLYIRKRHKCLYKRCNMGKDEPYYPKEIPPNAYYNFGMKVCDYTPK